MSNMDAFEKRWKASLRSAVIWVAPRTVVDKVGMNLERDNLWFSPNSVNLEAPAFSGCFFISISLLPGTLPTGGLPSQLEMAIAVQWVRNWQCGLRPTVQPPKCCFFTWTHSKWFKRFLLVVVHTYYSPGCVQWLYSPAYWLPITGALLLWAHEMIWCCSYHKPIFFE